MSQPKRRRAIVLIIDSVGVGAMPDAPSYGDPLTCSTLGNVAQACQGLSLPNLEKLGLGNIIDVEGVAKVSTPEAAFGKMAELAPGKDTSTGHWELAGVILDEPLALFPNGFPAKIIDEFVERTGRGILGNKPASGTAIIDELAEEQRKTGKWIVYTSADSVFQIAAHEEVIPLPELYRACEIAREILDPYQLGRIIARPYIGSPGAYERTYNRKDYALPPPGETVLDRLTAASIPVIGVGKIGNIFAEQGVSESHHTHGNHDGMMTTMRLLKEVDEGFIFVNLVDFDAKYGHRNDAVGYGKALEEFDRDLGELLPLLREDDLLMISADHGCDPTTPGTDHSREYVPIIAKHPKIGNIDLGIRDTFGDMAQTLADFWGIEPMSIGTSLFPSKNS